MMRIYKRLVRIFLHAVDMDSMQQKNQKIFYVLLGLVSLVGILLPCCVLVGAISYALTLGMGENPNGLIFLLHFVSLFAIIFGISVIFNVFYFSGDIPHILPLPISPVIVIAAKFTAAYITESAMEMLLLFSAMTGFFMATQWSAGTFLFALLGSLTLPIVPLCYGAIVCIVLMGSVRWIRNKSHIRRLSVVFNVLIVLLSVWALGLLGNLDLEHIADQIGGGQLRFLQLLNVIFPTNLWFGRFLAQQEAETLICYVIFHILVLAVFLLTAKLLYYKGLMAVGINEDSGSTGFKRRLVYGKRKRRAWAAYLHKELLILLRTPPFFLNCIAINLLWPGLGYVILMLQADSPTFARYLELYRNGNEAMRWIATLIVLAVSVLLVASNSIAASSLTREGKQFSVMKYLPLSYEMQLQVKALVSILISGGFALVYLLAAGLYIRIPVRTLLYYVVICVQQIIFISYFGVLLDTVQPKLVWEDEVNALRANRNVFFNMAYAMLITVFFLLVLFAIYRYTKLPLELIQLFLFLILVVADYGMAITCLQKGTKNMRAL